MKILPNVVLVVGFCLATLGAAGFTQPREDNAMTFLVVGMAVLVVGGLWHRQVQKSSGEPTDHGPSLAGFVSAVEEIRKKVVELDDQKGSLHPDEIHHRIDLLMRNEYFDLTSRNEELVGLVGFNHYAEAWDGVATAERLLNRCWSMITDGFAEEGLAELPLAREHIEAAAARFVTLRQH
jgi:hypothetical protein